jgi:hypothetical protein
MSRRAVWVVFLAVWACGCEEPEAILEAARPELEPKMKKIKLICDKLKQDIDAEPNKVKLPKRLVSMEPGRKTKPEVNALLVESSVCPELDYSHDDPRLKLGISSFSFGYSSPLVAMADVYLRKGPYAVKSFGADSAKARAYVAGIRQLEYLMVWVVDEMVLPQLDEAAKTYAPGSFKGRVLVYRVEDAKLLKVAAIKAENGSDVSILYGERTVRSQEQVYTRERNEGAYTTYDKYPSYKTRTTTKTLNLGTWSEAAARNLLLDLSFKAEDAAQAAVPYEEAAR